jgi:hypothetical protein
VGAEGPALKPGAALLPISMNGTKRFSPDGGRRWDFHPEETYKSLITISVEALKMVALINGGAAVALLAYLGNLTSHSGGRRPPNMTWALMCFAIGLFFTVLAFISSYFTQLRLYNEDRVADGLFDPGTEIARAILADPKQPWGRRIEAWFGLRSHYHFMLTAFILILLATFAFGIGCIVAAVKFAKG